MLAYRILLTVLAPALALAGLYRWIRGRETRDSLAGRLGLVRAPDDPRPTIWLHAASNGELASARPVIARLRRLRPGHRLLITTNSLGGRAMAADLADHAQTAPIDLRWVLGGFLRRWRIDTHVLVESEFWPNRLTLCHRHGIPVLALGVRLSARSARGWRKRPALTRKMLASLSFLSCQDTDTASRLTDLGLPPGTLRPDLDLKALYDVPEATPEAGIDRALPRERTWLAASTHAGEDEIVLEAHAIACKDWPDLRLILAPRHPDRGDGVARLIATATGTPPRRRSRGEPPLDRDGAVYLADTLGEMPLWYRASGIVFIGGTLTDRGGHTPFEPAAFGCALVHGPDTRNFRAPFDRLRAARAAEPVRDAQSLAAALLTLRDRQAQAGALARQVLVPPPGALDELMARLEPLLPDD